VQKCFSASKFMYAPPMYILQCNSWFSGGQNSKMNLPDHRSILDQVSLSCLLWCTFTKFIVSSHKYVRFCCSGNRRDLGGKMQRFYLFELGKCLSDKCAPYAHMPIDEEVNLSKTKHSNTNQINRYVNRNS